MAQSTQDFTFSATLENCPCPYCDVPAVVHHG